MPIMSVSEVREHVETDLGDTALGRLIDDADQEIIDRLGAVATHTEVLDGGGDMLHLQRKASSIASVVERIAEENYTLATSDYQLLSDGYRVERLQGSGYPNLTWQGLVTIAYATATELVPRKGLLVKLVKLAADYVGKRSVGIGDANVAELDYEAEKTRLFNGMQSRNRRLRLV